MDNMKQGLLWILRVILIYVTIMGESIFTFGEFCNPTDKVTMNMVFCNREPVILECMDTQYISVIKHLSFGRTTDPYCGNINHPDDSKVITDCTDQSNAEEKIRKKCLTKQSCQVLSTEFEGSDCGSGSRYVNITYTCHEVIDSYGKVMMLNETVCQDKQLTIDCKKFKGNVIVSSATYGRTDPELCYGSDKNTNALTCRARSSTSVVESMCDGKTNCTIKASNSVFGDPCPNVFKYLHVKYICS